MTDKLITDVYLLSNCWNQAMSSSGVRGTLLKDSILERLPILCNVYNLPQVLTFEEFLSAYDEKYYHSIYSSTRPNERIIEVCLGGDRRMLQLAIQDSYERLGDRSVYQFEHAIKIAAGNGRDNFVQMLKDELEICVSLNEYEYKKKKGTTEEDLRYYFSANLDGWEEASERDKQALIKYFSNRDFRDAKNRILGEPQSDKL